LPGTTLAIVRPSEQVFNKRKHNNNDLICKKDNEKMQNEVDVDLSLTEV